MTCHQIAKNPENSGQKRQVSAVAPRFPKQHFMGLEFDIAERSEWLPFVLQPISGGFEYIVTPNVYHLILLDRDPEILSAYAEAYVKICDSRVLNRLAQSMQIDLKVYPGADIVQDLLADPKASQLKFAIIGPDLPQVQILRKRYPGIDLHHVDAEMLQRGSAAWEKTLIAAEASEADVFLICLSFPKQEYFAQDLKRRGRTRGMGLCVGASIDFLTDRQKRAPKWVRARGMEWGYRLLANPKRMWRRYLWDGPEIIWMFIRWRFQFARTNR